MSETTKVVSHEEAKAIALRLIAGSFRRDGENLEYKRRPRFSIPCMPNDDDDCLILAYIAQQEATALSRATDGEG